MVELKSASGESEAIHATADHPWFTASHQWVTTEALKSGDLIETATGTDFRIVSISFNAKLVQTYNLTVADLHTYLVGKNQAVVHNSCLERYIKQYGKAGIRTLENGRTRFYGNVSPAKTSGEMAGRRYVKEYDPVTGRTRGWHETIDHNGGVRQVRPDNTTTHYKFNKNGDYAGSW